MRQHRFKSQNILSMCWKISRIDSSRVARHATPEPQWRASLTFCCMLSVTSKSGMSGKGMTRLAILIQLCAHMLPVREREWMSLRRRFLCILSGFLVSSRCYINGKNVFYQILTWITVSACCLGWKIDADITPLSIRNLVSACCNKRVTCTASLINGGS